MHHPLVARLSVAAELSDAERSIVIRDTIGVVRRGSGVVVSEEGSPINWVNFVLRGIACRYKQHLTGGGRSRPSSSRATFATGARRRCNGLITAS